MFSENGYQGWTMRHAFFLEMGGFLVRTKGASTMSFPVTADQLLFLIQSKHIRYPICDETAIEDKNKRDGLSR